MTNLIQNLLLLSQVESYQLRPGEGERVAVSEIMANVMSAMEKFDDKDRAVWNYPDDFFLLGIKSEIEGICINLVENAFKYSTPGTPIEVNWTRNSRGEYVFSVADRGPGIDEQDTPRILERYYRSARTAAEVPGSGLGLAIVQQAAHKHGARLDIDNHPGKSAVFSVTFPSYRCHGDERKTARIIRLADF